MFAGERFILDLDEENKNGVPHAGSPPDLSSLSVSSPSLNLMGDIQERQPTSIPAPPKPPSSTTGFPQHKKRSRPSAFKRQRDKNVVSSPLSAMPQESSTMDKEKQAINDENRQRLESMSPAQIEEERAELISSIDPSLLQRFLRRARIDEHDPTIDKPTTIDIQNHERVKPKKSVSFADMSESSATSPPPPSPSAIPSNPIIEDLPPRQPPEDLHPASEYPSTSFQIHFPKPTSHQNSMPNLDPSSPSFLSDLQSHYFPDLSHDPSLITWLQPPSTDSDDPESSISAYHPASDAQAVVPSAVRFSLLGTPLAPATSLSLPTTLGLHHHGRDPHAAGYTIPELAILGRSTFPAQRCIAWQVIGRILFRLGKGQFGVPGSTLVDGLWDVIEHEAVVAGMLAEADGSDSGASSSVGTGDKDVSDRPIPGGAFGKHASASAWAVEGVWLWQMGGGGDRGLLKEGAFRSR